MILPIPRKLQENAKPINKKFILRWAKVVNKVLGCIVGENSRKIHKQIIKQIVKKRWWNHLVPNFYPFDQQFHSLPQASRIKYLSKFASLHFGCNFKANRDKKSCTYKALSQDLCNVSCEISVSKIQCY